MSHEELKKLVYATAVETAQRGYGWAQERVVLGAVARQLKLDDKDLEMQQAVLTAWHDLFLEKKLSWGFDVHNPNAPFFHVSRRGSEPPAEAPSLATGKS